MYSIKLYPEITCQYNFSDQKLFINSAWLAGQLTFPVNLTSELERFSGQQLEEIINSNKEHFPDKDLPFLPFCYVVSRQLSDFKKSFIQPETNFNKQNSIAEVLNLLEIKPEGFNLNYNYIPKSWSWDIIDGLKNSKIDTTEYYDPVSVYTAIRRLRNIDVSARQFSKNLSTYFNEILNLNESNFFSDALRILAQGYYITLHCVECLTPGLEFNSFFSKKLRDYISEENGHHRLILQSINKLEKYFFPHYDKVFPETVILSDSLKYCASKHPVAFCCLIGAFEQASQFDSDPLADLLLQTSLPEAADGIAKHFRINKLGNHAEVGLDLIMDFPPVDLAEVLAAFRFCELNSIMLEGISYNILNGE